MQARYVNLEASESLWRLVYIGRIEADCWPDFQEALANVPMSSVAGWNCQNWVWDGINSLVQEGLLVLNTQGTDYLRTLTQKKWRHY